MSRLSEDACLERIVRGGTPRHFWIRTAALHQCCATTVRIFVYIVISLLIQNVAAGEDLAEDRVVSRRHGYFAPEVEIRGVFDAGERVKVVRAVEGYVLVEGVQSGTRGWIPDTAVIDPVSAPKSDVAVLTPENVSRLNDVALTLLRSVDRYSESTALSPYGVWANLECLRRGASGETREEIEFVIGSASVSSTLRLQGTPGFRGFHTVNGLWKRPGIELTETYRSFAHSVHLDVRDNDFDERGRREVNHWVAENSAQQIHDFISEGSWKPDMELMLVNVTTFACDWEKPFEPELINERFYITPKEAIQTKMMRYRGALRMVDDRESDSVILDLPYADKVFAGLIVVPNQLDGLTSLIRQLDSERITNWNKQAADIDVVLAMPEFEVSASFDLTAALIQLGISRAFGAEAEFRNLTPSKRVGLSSVIQKTVVKVDRKGTQAASGTGSNIVSVGPQSPVRQIFVDHPFLFLVQHRPTGAIVFACAVKKP